MDAGEQEVYSLGSFIAHMNTLNGQLAAHDMLAHCFPRIEAVAIIRRSAEGQRPDWRRWFDDTPIPASEYKNYRYTPSLTPEPPPPPPGPDFL